jgi:hypothetical protein
MYYAESVKGLKLFQYVFWGAHEWTGGLTPHNRQVRIISVMLNST